ncbi:integrase [Burkholderia vietnamiensis]|uniref:integrase n=1 Tax=Burkholderia vietnamiensis TaxID=60552 RepID=UPI001B99D9A4|nr:site-specific integrase [Burkholderia vietnamiensis]MBR8216278.1 site-specific integrase [Burkholderia vietnamiensis]
MATITKRKGARGVTFNVKIRKKGYPLVSRSFKDGAEAKEWAAATELAMIRGEAPRDRTAHEMTVGQALERYSKEIMPHHRGKRPESYRVKALLQSPLSDVTFAELNSKIISSWRDDRLKTVTGGSVLRELTILRAVIRAARSDWGVSLVEDPMKFVRKPKDNKPRERVITPNEEMRLYDGCNRVRNKLLRPAIEWAILSCMRQGEQFSMTWPNVNFDQRFVFLPMTKNGTARQVPMSLRMMEILRSLPRSASDDVWEGLSVFAVQHAFPTLTKNVGVENAHWHDLRHTGVTRLLSKGLHPLEVARVSGHRAVQMLFRYYHPSASDLAAKMDH